MFMFNRRIESLRVSHALVIAFALVVMPTNALAFTFTTIDVPGATSTQAVRINPQGDIVGTYTSGGALHGFLLHQGTFTTVDVPGSTDTEILGINPQGDVVGLYIAGGVFHGFLLHRGAFTTIDPPGSTLTIAYEVLIRLTPKRTAGGRS